MRPCPSHDQLHRLLDQQLGDTDRAALEAHIDACTDCQGALEDLTRDATLNLRMHAEAARAVPGPDETFLAMLRSGPRPEGGSRGQGSEAERCGESSKNWPVVAGYEILGELGRGGMGIVYKARDLRLKRVVALKILLAARQSDARERTRFRAEAEAVARLQHPNIVQVHEIGEHDGLPFFSLEYCPGGSLDEQLNGTPLPARAAASLVETLARAMHHAHDRGVIHRDLKPANILLMGNGEWGMGKERQGASPSFPIPHSPFPIPHSSFPIVKITDFGLAKQMGVEAGQTGTGTVVGTPSYMAPEQAASPRGTIGPAVDVYALGAVLYEVLTGRPPFKGASPIETIQQVAWVDPVPPSRLQPKVPRDLETICLKCLHKDPHHRYLSAETLADDLRRFLEGKPILARRTGPLGVAWRFCRRNPYLAVTSFLAAASLLAVTALSIVFAFSQVDSAKRVRAEKDQTRLALDAVTVERNTARTQRRLAEGRRLEAEEGRALLAFDRAVALCEQGEDGLGVLWLEYALEIALRADAKDLQRAIRLSLSAWGGRLHPLQGCLTLKGTARAVRGDARAVLTYDDNRTRLWDVATGKQIGASMIHRGLYAACFSPDHQTVFTYGSDRAGQLWDVASGQKRGQPLATQGRYLATAVFTPDSKYILTTGLGLTRDKIEEGTAQCWDVSNGQPVGDPIACFPPIQLEVSPDSQKVLVTRADSTVWVYRMPSGKAIGQLKGLRRAPRSAAFSHNGKYVVTGEKGWAQRWEADSCRALTPLLMPEMADATITTVAFSPNDLLVATAGTDGVARIWSVKTHKPIGPPLRHLYHILYVTFSPDGRWLLTCSADNTTRLWDLDTSRSVGGPLYHRDEVTFAAFTPDGKTVLTVGKDQTARLWQLNPVAYPKGIFASQLRPTTSMGLSKHGSTIYTANANGIVWLWSPSTGESRKLTLLVPPDKPSLMSLALSPDSTTFLAGYTDGTAHLWTASTGEKGDVVLSHPPLDGLGLVLGSCWEVARRERRVGSTEITGVAFSPNGSSLATASLDHTARLWDAATGWPLGVPLRHSDSIWAIAFSPDGKTVLTGSHDHTAQLWDAATGKPLGVTLRHDGYVNAVAFSPDGKTLMTGSWDKTARLWDAATGRPRGVPMVHQSYVNSVSFSPDGKTVLTGSADWSARLWEANTGRPIGPAYRHPSAVWRAAFHPDGRSLLTRMEDGRVWQWPVPEPMAGEPDAIKRRLETATGLELDAGQASRVLDADSWEQHRKGHEEARP